MRTPFDVNMLLALFDAEHLHHTHALSWWTANRENGWASCPLTQNGFVRAISGQRYSRVRSLAEAIALLCGQIGQPGHEFWRDEVSIIDSNIIDHDRLLGPRQITDVYLLALAVKNGGRLATFDRAIPVRAVPKRVTSCCYNHDG